MYLVFVFASSFTLLEAFITPMSRSTHLSQFIYILSGFIGFLGLILFFKHEELQTSKNVTSEAKISSRSYIIMALNLSFFSSLFLLAVEPS